MFFREVKQMAFIDGIKEKAKLDKKTIVLPESNDKNTAFDAGITHFDLANNYGPVYGSAEENFGRILDRDMRPSVMR